MGMSYGSKYYTYSFSPAGAVKNIESQSRKKVGKYNITDLHVEKTPGSNIYERIEIPRKL